MIFDKILSESAKIDKAMSIYLRIMKVFEKLMIHDMLTLADMLCRFQSAIIDLELKFITRKSSWQRWYELKVSFLVRDGIGTTD